MSIDEEFEAQFERGLELFNAGEFYACHDTIEDLWLQESSSRQPFLQGIIQAAVAFHHYQHGKLGAARAMMALAIEKLDPYPREYRGVEVHSLLRELRIWAQEFSRRLAEAPSQPAVLRYPKITRC